ncbi:MAG: spondin domain-containing protein [Actinomycetota bacterium]
MRRAIISLAAILSASGLASSAGADGPDHVATYRVTVTNSTTGQWFTPPAAATHNKHFDLFSTGNSASVAVQEIAENGNLAAATGAFAASPFVHDWVVAPAPTGPPPIGPGSSVTFEITAPRDGKLSIAAMLICTNDGFTGVDSIKLPRGMGHTVTKDLAAYDAGTETNTEAWADLVPPCAELTGFGAQGGTGLSNPALAQNGVITTHPGVAGVANLVPAVHGWTGPVGTVTITRVG